jgi:hypothetical protein
VVDVTGQPYAYTGGDPVNSMDPSGMTAGHGGPDAACKRFRDRSRCEAEVRAEVGGVPCSDQWLATQTGPEALGLVLLVGPGGIADFVEGLEGVTAASDDLLQISEDNLSHIFREAPGHLASDTAENRLLLQNAVNPDNYIGTNPISGVSTYRQLLPSGEQVWVEVRQGIITNGGVNPIPR